MTKTLTNDANTNRVQVMKTAKATTYVCDQCRAVVPNKPNEDTGEFRVKLYQHARWLDAADYFTDDKQDAHGTARLMVVQLADRIAQGGAA